MTGNTGDYGLPAAARYGGAASRPMAMPDTGLGNTTSESTSPSGFDQPGLDMPPLVVDNVGPA